MDRKLICILIANLFAVPAALAQQADGMRITGSVTAGGIHTDDDDVRDASKLNEYQDLSSGGLFGFDIAGRSSRHWFDLFGENIGRDDQYLNLRGGVYDVFKYRLFSDSLKHNFLWNGLTPYNGAGSPAHRTTFPRLDTSTWNELDVAYKRRDDGGFFEFQGVNPWYFRVDANQVSWKGSKSGAASQGTSPGNGFVDLAFPVDYKTRNVTVEGGYNTRPMQASLSYMVSKFENSEELVTWTNGFFGNGIDTTFLAADNRYQRLAGNATFRDLPWGTVVAARFTVDELESSIPLVGQVLGSGGAMQATGPNVASFEGKVENQTFSLSVTSAPVRALDTRIYYNYREREDSSTPVSFNSAAIPGPITNHTFSYEKSNFGFDAYYRINRHNRFGGGFDYLDTEREGRHDFDRTKDRRIFLEYKNNRVDELALRLKYTRLDRDSNFLLGNSGTSPTDAAYWERYVTAFDVSDVKQDQWKLTLDWSPMPYLDVGFEGMLKKNEFDENTLGRLKDDRREIYLSASYGVPGGPRFTVFGDHEEIEYESYHRIVGSGSTSGAYEPSTPPNASNYNWAGRVRDRNMAAGFAVDWPVNDRLAIKASAIYYKTDGLVDLGLQEGVPASVTPPVNVSQWDDSKRQSFTIKAVWHFSKRLTFTGGYAYEKYEFTDSQVEGYRFTIPSSSAGQDSYLNGVNAFNDYKANIFFGTLSWRF